MLRQKSATATVYLTHQETPVFDTLDGFGLNRQQSPSCAMSRQQTPSCTMTLQLAPSHTIARQKTPVYQKTPASMPRQQSAGLGMTIATPVRGPAKSHAQKVQQNTRLLPALPFRLLLLFVGVLGLLRRRSTWGEANKISEEPLVEAMPSGPRDFLQAGSVYQNDYMTLWNAKKMPISVTLRVQEGDGFQLRIEHLNSAGGGSDGWLAIQGGFRLQPLPDTPGRLFLIPVANGDKVVDYDESVFDRGTAFVLRCMQKLSGPALLKAIELEVDMKRDAVMVTPRSSSLRMLWAQPVALKLTSEEELWEPSPDAEASAKPLVV